MILDSATTKPDPTAETDPAGPLEPGPADALDSMDIESANEAADAASGTPLLPPVTLLRGAVPGELDPGRFLTTMCNLVLDRTPVNFHSEARARRRAAMD